MMLKTALQVIRVLLLALMGLALVPELHAGVWFDGLPMQLARKPQQDTAGSQISADQAAIIASRETGGRVLKVKPSGAGFSVRVLLSNGQVRTVQVTSDGSVHD